MVNVVAGDRAVGDTPPRVAREGGSPLCTGMTSEGGNASRGSAEVFGTGESPVRRAVAETR